MIESMNEIPKYSISTNSNTTKFVYLTHADYLYFLLDITGLHDNDIEHMIINAIPLKTPYRVSETCHDYMKISNDTIIVFVAQSEIITSRRTIFHTIYTISGKKNYGTFYRLVITGSSIECVLYSNDNPGDVSLMYINNDIHDVMIAFINTLDKKIPLEIFADDLVIDIVNTIFRIQQFCEYPIKPFSTLPNIHKQALFKKHSVKPNSLIQTVCIAFLTASVVLINSALEYKGSKYEASIKDMAINKRDFAKKQQQSKKLMDEYSLLVKNPVYDESTPLGILESISLCADSSLLIDTYSYSKKGFSITGIADSSILFLANLEEKETKYSLFLTNVVKTGEKEKFSLSGKLHEKK